VKFELEFWLYSHPITQAFLRINLKATIGLNLFYFGCKISLVMTKEILSRRKGRHDDYICKKSARPDP
jgi:hypothetical protein